MGNVVRFRRATKRGGPRQRHKWLPPAFLAVGLLVLLGTLGSGFTAAGWFRAPASNAQGSSNPIVGRASVIDGDTVEVHGIRIRLYGIDAPESGQTCSQAGEDIRCGQQAAFALAHKIGSAPISCEQKDRDRYGRVVAVCRLGALDLNAWMVEQGWAVAYRHYSSDYVSQEAKASLAKLGVWKTTFELPWEWRREHSSRPVPAIAPNSCNIKGNIARSGERIYHVPGGEFYDRTLVEPTKAERWFCNEEEARAAGWRRSRR
jgi:endonuclease YncB( thermonuclease family)